MQPGSTARAWGTQVLSSGEGTKDVKISSTAAQAVELLRNRMSIDVSFRVVLPTQSGCCFKKKKKKEETQHKQKKPKLCDRQCLAGRYYVGCIVFQVSSPHLKELCLFYGSQTRHFFSWLSTLGAFFGASFTQPEQEPELLMIWALLIYTYHWLKTPACNSYCTLFQCTGGKQSHCLPYVSNNKHKPGD